MELNDTYDYEDFLGFDKVDDYAIPGPVHWTLCSVALLFNVICITGIVAIPGRLSLRHRIVVGLCFADALLVINELWRDPLYISWSVWWQECVSSLYKSLKMASHLLILSSLSLMAAVTLIAISRPLDYPRLTTGRRPSVVLWVTWILAFAIGFSNFLSGAIFYSLDTFQTEGYCRTVNFNDNLVIRFYVHSVTTSLCVVINVVSYCNIILIVRKRQSWTIQHGSTRSSTRKATVTSLLILATFLLFYLPYDIVDSLYWYVTTYGLFKEDKLWIYLVAHNHTSVIQKLNSVFDPIIYAARQNDVRQSLKRITCYIYPKPRPRPV